MKLLTAAALVAMVAGCSMLPTRDTSGSSGATSSGTYAQSGVKQSPYWAGCYFYPGCKNWFAVNTTRSNLAVARLD